MEHSSTNTIKEKVREVMMEWENMLPSITDENSDDMLARAMDLIYSVTEDTRSLVFQETFLRHIPDKIITIQHQYVSGDYAKILPVPGVPRYIKVTVKGSTLYITGWSLSDINLSSFEIYTAITTANRTITRLALDLPSKRTPSCWGPAKSASYEEWAEFKWPIWATQISEISIYLTTSIDICAEVLDAKRTEETDDDDELMVSIRGYSDNFHCHDTNWRKETYIAMMSVLLSCFALLGFCSSAAIYGNTIFSICNNTILAVVAGLLFIWIFTRPKISEFSPHYFLIILTVMFSFIQPDDVTIKSITTLGIGGSFLYGFDEGVFTMEHEKSASYKMALSFVIVCFLGVMLGIETGDIINFLISSKGINITVHASCLFFSLNIFLMYQHNFCIPVSLFDLIDADIVERGFLVVCEIGVMISVCSLVCIIHIVQNFSAIYIIAVINIVMVYIAGILDTEYSQSIHFPRTYQFSSFRICILNSLYFLLYILIFATVTTIIDFFPIIYSFVISLVHYSLCVIAIYQLKFAIFGFRSKPKFILVFICVVLFSHNTGNITVFREIDRLLYSVDAIFIVKMLGFFVAYVIKKIPGPGITAIVIGLLTGLLEVIGFGIGSVSSQFSSGIFIGPLFVLMSLYVLYEIADACKVTHSFKMKRPVFHAQSATTPRVQTEKQSPIWKLHEREPAVYAVNSPPASAYLLGHITARQRQSPFEEDAEESGDDMDSYNGATYHIPSQSHYDDDTKTSVCHPELIYSNDYRVLQTVNVGEPFKLEIELRGGSNTDIIWIHDGEILGNNGRTQIITTETFLTLEILETIPSDSGLYVVRAENKRGIFESMFKLLVQDLMNESSDEKEITESLPPDTFGIKLQSNSKELLRHPKSSVVLTVPEGAVPLGLTCTITGRIHTHLNTFSQYLQPDSIFVAPVVEYATEQSVTFMKPVQIKIKHCVADEEGMANIKVFSIENGAKHKEIPKGLKDEHGYYVKGQYIYITTNHFCHYLCHTHEKKCKLVTTLNLFGSIQTTKSNHIFTFLNLLCLGCATLEEFQDQQRNALDPDMELKKRISIPMRQLDKYHTAKSTLDIDLSEWKFTDNGDPSQVHKFGDTLDCLDSINMFQIGDDYQIRTGRVTEVPGKMNMDFCDTNKDVLHSHALKFTIICPRETACKDMFGDVLPLTSASHNISDRSHSSGTTTEVGSKPSIWDHEEHELIGNVDHLQDFLNDKICDVLEEMPADNIFLRTLIKHKVINSQTKMKLAHCDTPADKADALFDEIRTVGGLRGLLFALADTRNDSIIRNLGFIPEECKEGAPSRAKAIANRKR